MSLSKALTSTTPPSHTTLRPGPQLIANLGLDIHYLHQNSSRTTPSTEQFSLASCIEYNPSPNFGLKVGPWFTLAGRNSPAFFSGVTTIYWYF